MGFKNYYYYLVVAVIVFGLFIFVSVFILSFKKPLEQTPLGQTPSEQSLIQATPTPKLSPFDIATKNSESISSQDFNVRERFISSSSDGYIYTTNTYKIIFMKDEGVFQIRILTLDVETAKAEAIDWLLSQGVSRRGICTLPVIFYVPPRTIEQLRKEGQEFSPLPEGC